jgi:hypothetical protein
VITNQISSDDNRMHNYSFRRSTEVYPIFKTIFLAK